MRKVVLSFAAFAAASASVSANAQIRVLASNADLTRGSLSLGLDAANRFTFSYSPRESFDLAPTLVQTSGTAAVTAFGGFLGIPLEPSTFFTRANVVVNASIFPGFAQFPEAARIPSSISPGDLGLRLTLNGEDSFGYARITGPRITVAFNTNPGQSITAGTVPEPATWAMMIGGFGMIGAVARRRARVRTIVAYS